MVAKLTGRQRFDRFRYFFPFRLVLLHLKRNHFLLLLWLILFGFTTQAFANKFGIPYLFLAPEYRGEVGIWSFAILGFALGGFIMAFNIYSYILHAKRFPFLGTLSRPFFKFCVNNFIIPLTFIGTYIYYSSKFLSTTQLETDWNILRNMLAFIFGNAIFIALAVIYFFPTNKNIFKITGNTAEQFEEMIRNKRSLGRKKKVDYSKNLNDWRVDTYLTNPFKINLARSTFHYDAATLEKVFYQNHVNASFFELLVVVAFFVVGAFQFTDFFVIPAAASACLVFTVILMIISISMSWLKGWTLSVLIVLIIFFDVASVRWDILNMANYAYGLDYEKKAVPYSTKTIDSLNSNLLGVSRDIEVQEAVLEKWLDKQRKLRGNPYYKPYIILVNTSGGGLRSSLWTLRVMQYSDSITNGAFFANTRLISGSSGGTIGAAYYRELYLNRDTLTKSLYNRVYLDNISKDVLNRVLYTFATNDIFIRFRKRQIGGRYYVLDRGMTFEDQLNLNTQGYFNKPVSAYREPVSQGLIPMMVLAPSVVNDGRRLLISSQPISYLSYEYPELKDRLNLTYENIEFNRLFANHGAQDLLMSSALRMNSTFPYILPYAGLPTEPSIEVMDAGLRDNFGMKITANYLYTFRKWIGKNTSGIIIVQIRDTQKHPEPAIKQSSVLDKITNPIGSFYGNYFTDQDYNMDQILKITDELVDVPLYHIPFEIRKDPGEHIALSWHLTELEKLRVINSIEMRWNQESLNTLQGLLNE